MNQHIDRSAAAQLLDFGKHIGQGQRANEQLDGAVALYNTLVDHRVAYLADEVGMGKTYVALGVVALLRHYRPSARVLVIAPRENIQEKWQGELLNLVTSNVRFTDMRVRGQGGHPVVAHCLCANLIEFAEEATRDPDRDFFLRLPSFSLPLRSGASGDEGARGLRDRLQAIVPWLDLDLRAADIKQTVGAAVNCLLPPFDLVIIDEAHNLKHGRGVSASDRNQVLARVLGHPDEPPTHSQLRGYKRLAPWTLLLSATPVEDSYRHLWNQLDLVGHGAAWKGLLDDNHSEEEVKAIIRKFLVRRVTMIDVAGQVLTKNLYRREWRRGGLETHDEPIHVDGDRQRLVLALVQKKVAELLPTQEFGARFQIGMLASFESFLETSKLQTESEVANFDDGEQTQDLREREGIDASDLRLLRRSYRREFDQELPHPKMDAVVKSLEGIWDRGEKALVFVRRVKSVKELKERLDDSYDAWLLRRLELELPASAWAGLQAALAQFKEEKRQARETGADNFGLPTPRGGGDTRGTDTLFAWLFRGEARRGILDGPRVRERYYEDTLFFEDNYVAAVLDCAPGEVVASLARTLGVDKGAMLSRLGAKAARHVRALKPARIDRFRAAQIAALEWINELGGPKSAVALAASEWIKRHTPKDTSRTIEVEDVLESRTFYTELRRRRELEKRIWPAPVIEEPVEAARERLHRAAMLSACARLGHAFLDLYTVTIKVLGDVSARTANAREDGEGDRITAFLDLLEQQMQQTRSERGWRAFDELADMAEHFDLVCRVNKLGLATRDPSEVRSTIGTVCGRQQPVGGMAGSVSTTLVQQFRHPGYPLVMVTTDVLQEGEDLHTFCSTILHYGITWTPSGMEQRTGRVDRVGSATDRRLGGMSKAPADHDLLQVKYPYLEDTIEVLQVDRVFERMNTFLQLMHKGLRTKGGGRPHVDVAVEMAKGRRHVTPIREVLETAFAVPAERTAGEVMELAVGREHGEALRARFARLARSPLHELEIDWPGSSTDAVLRGTLRLGLRTQPIALYLRSLKGRPVVRCISPVGILNPATSMAQIRAFAHKMPVRIGAVFEDEDRTYDVTVEGEVLLSEENADSLRVASLIRRIAAQADEIERALLEVDQPLSTFDDDLVRENHGD